MINERQKTLCGGGEDPMILSEFGRSIVAGTIQRMQQVAKRKGMPSWDHEVVGGT